MPAVAEAWWWPPRSRGSASMRRPCFGSGKATPCRRWTEVRAHFERSGAARQKWPEELHQVEDYPRTASGKVQKYLVRKGIREG